MTKHRITSIGRTLNCRERFRGDENLTLLLGTRLSAETFDQFAASVVQVLPKTAQPDAIRASLLHLAGREWNEELLDETAWRLSGNLPSLRQGKPVFPWNGQREDEWVPAEVISADRDYDRAGVPGAWFTFFVLGGSCCPVELRRFWTRRFCSYLGRTSLGFTRSSGPRPFRDVCELVGMRLALRISADMSLVAPAFDKVLVRQAHLEHNRILLKRRARKKEYAHQCPRQFPTSKLCHLCPVGKDECPIAVHEMTFVAGPCPRCKLPGWFDPSRRSGVCVSCRQNAIAAGGGAARLRL